MPIQLSGLAIDPVIDHDLPKGDALRIVNAAKFSIDVEEWQQDFDPTAVIFLLDAIYGASIRALVFGETTGFFALDDPMSGRVHRTANGRLEISVNDGGAYSISGFNLIAAIATALMEIAEFLTGEGYEKAAQILVANLAAHPAMSGRERNPK